MSRWRLVLRYDMIQRMSQPGFWLGGFLLPILGILVVVGIGYIRERALATQPAEPEPVVQGVGVVDDAGLLKMIPDQIPPEALLFYPTEAAARLALQQKAIQSYYVIPPDYLTTGKLQAYILTVNVVDMSEKFPDPWLRIALQANLLEGDLQKLGFVLHPMQLETEVLAPQQDFEGNEMLAFYIPYSVMLLFYMFVLMSASMLLNAIAVEKQNRVLEILLVSLRPLDLLIGKMASLALLSLAQLLVWTGSGLLILRLGGKALSLPSGVSLPPTLLAWGIIFFLLGYLIYAALLASVGALVSDVREASQVTVVIISPLMIPLFFITALIGNPHGSFSTVLSLIPLTSPVVMMTRLAMGNVPAWQLLAAIAGLVITAWFIVRAAANLFRTQLMLTGQPLTLKRYILALFGRTP